MWVAAEAVHEQESVATRDMLVQAIMGAGFGGGTEDFLHSAEELLGHLNVDRRSSAAQPASFATAPRSLRRTSKAARNHDRREDQGRVRREGHAFEVRLAMRSPRVVAESIIVVVVVVALLLLLVIIVITITWGDEKAEGGGRDPLLPLPSAFNERLADGESISTDGFPL